MPDATPRSQPISRTAAFRDGAAARWTTLKPFAIGAAGGLLAGPILSGMLGYQTRTSTADAAMRASVVEQQAAFCQERARAALPAGAARLEWGRAYDVARDLSAMPGGSPDGDVRLACARKLST